MPSIRRSPAQLPPDVSPPATQLSEPARYLRAQLRCYLCAETCGAIEGPPGRGFPALAHFYPADGSPARLLAWRTLRCRRCGSSSLFVDEPETLYRRVERIDWALDQPRRGRPPRWLVKRRAERDAA